MSSVIFRQLFDPTSSTYSYILGTSLTREAIIIDPVREYIDRDLTFLGELDLRLKYIIDTHIHADHITASGLLREKTWAQIIMGKGAASAGPDRLVEHNETFEIAGLTVRALATPGHTSGCTSFYIDGKLFTGDTLLIRKTGRTDFQGGSAESLYHSIRHILYTFDDDTPVYPWHDYTGRMMSTIGEEKKYNARINALTTFEEAIATLWALRLDTPKYIATALPANQRLGLDK